MLVGVDAKALEWLGIVWYSQDPQGMKEIREKIDQHTLNQKAFNLPDRLTAKTFVFRLIYGGSAGSYAKDPSFTHVSSKPKYWQKTIDVFYDKYKGIGKQHAAWMDEAITTGKLVMPTGRIYEYTPYQNYRGEMQWPKTTIYNYPIQGLGQDLMSCVRVLLARYRKEQGLENDVKFVSTVHDSIYCDVKDHFVEPTIRLYKQAFLEAPEFFSTLFNADFNLPMGCEISVGPNMGEMVEIK